MTVPEAATTEGEHLPTGDVPTEEPEAARAAYAAEDVVDELRKAYLAIVAAFALLKRTDEGSTHPALRRAEHCAEDAINLVTSAEDLICDGIGDLRIQLGVPNGTSVGELIGALEISRTQFAEVAERVAGYPERLRAAGQRLRDAGEDAAVTGNVAEQWSDAGDQLRLLTESLTGAVSALATYTDRVTGAAS